MHPEEKELFYNKYQDKFLHIYKTQGKDAARQIIKDWMQEWRAKQNEIRGSLQNW